MKKFVVLCCYNGDNEKPKFFDTYEEAYGYLKSDYERVVKSYPDHIDGVGGEINKYDAWLHEIMCRCYWKIVEVEIPCK